MILNMIERGKYLYLLKELMKKDFTCFNNVNIDTMRMLEELEEKGLVEYITIKNMIVRARISMEGLKLLKNELTEDILIYG